MAALETQLRRKREGRRKVGPNKRHRKRERKRERERRRERERERERETKKRERVREREKKTSREAIACARPTRDPLAPRGGNIS